MPGIIDSHQHFWKLSKPFDYAWLDASENSRIRRDYLPSHLGPLLREVGIERSVFVQTQHDVEENRWVLKLADENPFIAGVVGWVDLASRDCEQQVLEFRSHPKFVGVRHITHNEPDDDFILRPDVLRGLKILEKHVVPFDLLFFVRHLNHTVALARLLPDLPMVIDHLAKPRIKDQRLDDWLPSFKAAAKHPNVFCKISGMITEADWATWKPSDLTPYIDAALECFGPSRLMFGSDWPVCELAGSYRRVFEAAKEHIDRLSPAEQDMIWSGTATHFYRL